MADVAIGFGHGENTWESGGGKGVRKGGVVYEEFHANQDVGLQVEAILKRHGVSTVLTQPANSNDVGLASRVATARRNKVKVLIEIHFNAGVASARGACVFAWGTNSPRSHRLQDLIVGELNKAKIATHGNGKHYSKLNDWTNLYITRVTQSDPFATVLVEGGFMTNAIDFELIFGSKKKEYRAQIALVYAKAILAYLGVAYKEEVIQVSNPIASAMTDKTDRIGTVVLKTDMNYREQPSLNSKVIRVLPAGHGSNGNVHLYEVKGDWLRLGVGWVSNAGGKYVDVKMYPVAPVKPKEPAKPVYRVIVDGEQVGAYAEDSSILRQIQQAVPHLKENIVIEKV